MCEKNLLFFQQFEKKTPAHSLVQSSIWHPLNDAMLFCKVICPSKIFVVHSKFFFELGRLETIRASSCRGPSPATMQDDATPISMYLTVFFTFFYILHTCFLKKFKKKIRKLKKILPLLISGGIRPKCDLRSSPQFSRLKLCQTRYVRAVIFQAGLRKNKAGTSVFDQYQDR